MENAVSNQNQQVEQHLKTYGSTTSWEAFELYGITRLSARIYDLRRENEIMSKPMSTTNRFGNTVNYVKYVYMGGKVCRSIKRAFCKKITPLATYVASRGGSNVTISSASISATYRRNKALLFFCATIATTSVRTAYILTEKLTAD